MSKNVTVTEIAKKFGVKQSRIHFIIKKLGIHPVDKVFVGNFYAGLYSSASVEKIAAFLSSNIKDKCESISNSTNAPAEDNAEFEARIATLEMMLKSLSLDFRAFAENSNNKAEVLEKKIDALIEMFK